MLLEYFQMIDRVESVDAEIVDRVAFRRNRLAIDLACLRDDVGNLVECSSHARTSCELFVARTYREMRRNCQWARGGLLYFGNRVLRKHHALKIVPFGG